MSDYTKMGNEEIGEFCLKAGRKLAKDVYTIAKAIKVVHDRIGGKKGEFKAWREKYIPFISKATAYRYLAVAEIDPAQIGENEGITELYKRFFIIPAEAPADPTPTPTTAVSRTTTVGGDRPTDKAPDSVDDLIQLIASQPGAKKQGLTPNVLAKMSEEAILDMAKQLQSPAGQPAGVTVVGDNGTQVGELRVYIPDENITPEQAEDRRMSEHADALVIAGDKAKPFPSLINADPKDLLAYLSEFGVRPEDIAALSAA